MRKKFDYQLWKNYRHLRNLKFTSLSSFLLLGFLTGNLFGTILGKIRELFYWDGFIIFFLIIFFEVVSYAAYSKHTKRLSFLKFVANINQIDSLKSSRDVCDAPTGQSHVYKTTFNAPTYKSKICTQRQILHVNFWKFANFFKIGIMIGFFVDAFKVGS